MRSRHRAVRSLPSLLCWAAALLLITALSASAASAWSGGVLFKMSHGKKMHRAISPARNVSHLRLHRHEHWPTTPPPDTTPPETTIASGPSSSTTATSAAFAFASSEPGSSFECKLDGGGWNSCASPASFSGLGVGSHQFSVRAKDAAGNVDATPAVFGWTIETVSPPPPPSECTSTVTSTSAAQSAVSSATTGSVICLANGKYGKVTLSASKAAPGVTLKAENPGQATIESASLSGSHLTLARFVIPNGVVIQPGANSMTVEHNRITGGGEGIDACPTEKTYCSEERIIGNQLIGPFGEDAIHANRYHGLLIEGNEITGVRENGSHSDCLQTVWRGDHLSFRKNYLHDNRCQGFFVKDQTMSTPEIPGGPVEGITVEDNLFLRNREPCGAPLGPSECGQPMYFQLVGPYNGFVMKRNTIWGDGVDSIAAFRGEGSGGIGSDTLVENNVIYRIWTDWNMTPATLRNNTDCMRETSGAGAWSTPTGETKACSLSFANPAADDYRLGGERGVDWAPAEQHFGP
jgi:parallel beta helix pectate lyase-like protein